MAQTWTILKIIGQYPSKFNNIRALHLDYDDVVHDAICDIPASFMVHIRDIQLSDQTYMNSDPTRFMDAASSLI